MVQRSGVGLGIATHKFPVRNAERMVIKLGCPWFEDAFGKVSGSPRVPACLKFQYIWTSGLIPAWYLEVRLGAELLERGKGPP